MTTYRAVLQEITNLTVTQKIVEVVPTPLQLAAYNPYELMRKAHIIGRVARAVIGHVRNSLDRMYNFSAVELVADGPACLHVNEDIQRMTTSLARDDAEFLMRAFASQFVDMQRVAENIVVQDAELVRRVIQKDDSGALRTWHEMHERLDMLRHMPIE